ncbi:M56 family metallopeptidase [Flavobacterium rakeshii]|uniref:M56 family metallopeptidase n=1 Tax=Flavobacterium rakeshii TaxID=1038845 RepID=UPI002E7BAE90|nr:M56 family metallopeptidase [Flavobacterium rakeshii]MEE1897862.1 M56 family metallopeptidase [Flavobacterium rakeshii]
MSEFLIKSAISMAALFLLYKLFLEKEKMHRFNRSYLLFSLIFSLCLPFITIPIYVSIPTISIENPVTVSNIVMSPQMEYGTVTNVVLQPNIVWALYSIVTLLLVIRFTINITRLYKLKKRNQNIPYKGATLVLIDNNILPHTFLNTVYISKEEYENQAIEPEVYSHELTHVKQRHTLDILFIELLKTILWFNPLLYFYKKAIQLNHEFLADETVIYKKNIISYQQLLLNRSQQKAPTAMLASNFNFPITKKRFVMMTKTTPKLRAAFLQIGTLPLITALILLLCTQANAQEPQLSDEAVAKLEKFRATDTEIKQFKENNPEAFSDNPEVAFKNTEFTFTDKKGNSVNKKGYANLNKAEKEMVKLSPVRGAGKLEFVEEQE